MLNIMKRKNTAKEGSLMYRLNEHPICSVLYDLEFKEGRAWLNPNDQMCFHSGHYEEQDFEDWMNGVGKIVKGRDAEEKAIVWEYAKFMKEYNHAHSISYNYKFFHLITDSNPNLSTHNYSILDYNGENAMEIISRMYGTFVGEISRDFNNREYDSVRREYQDTLWGVKKTLMMFGIGYLASSNTPQDILNHSWISDVVFSKAYYLYLKNKGVKFPNFDFMENNRGKL
jgi:hypothetical protein